RPVRSRSWTEGASLHHGHMVSASPFYGPEQAYLDRAPMNTRDTPAGCSVLLRGTYRLAVIPRNGSRHPVFVRGLAPSTRFQMNLQELHGSFTNRQQPAAILSDQLLRKGVTHETVCCCGCRNCLSGFVQRLCGHSRHYSDRQGSG